jgi:hypothetical protein
MPTGKSERPARNAYCGLPSKPLRARGGKNGPLRLCERPKVFVAKQRETYLVSLSFYTNGTLCRPRPSGGRARRPGDSRLIAAGC